MRILVIGDPIEQVRPQSDTSLALMHAAAAHDHTFWWATGDDIELWGRDVVAKAAPLESAPQLKTIPQIGAPTRQSITWFDIILIRKNPPFDPDYFRLCSLLLPFEKQVVMSNPPSFLLQHHEKMVPFQAITAGHLRREEFLPTLVTSDPEAVRAFVAEHQAERWVIKPWLGYAGHNVRKLKSIDGILAALEASHDRLLIQPFLPEVQTAGDRRVFFVKGKHVADLVRIPPNGDFISNLALGGTGKLAPMDDKARDRARRLGEYLGSVGCDFAGADFIGDYVTEVNVTSPTGLVALADLGGPDVSAMVVDCVEERALSLRGA